MEHQNKTGIFVKYFLKKFYEAIYSVSFKLLSFCVKIRIEP